MGMTLNTKNGSFRLIYKKDTSRLTLRHLGIARIDGLGQLTALYHLNLRSNHLKKIKGLENIAELSSLYLKNNKLNNLRGLPYLAKL